MADLALSAQLLWTGRFVPVLRTLCWRRAVLQSQKI